MFEILPQSLKMGEPETLTILVSRAQYLVLERIRKILRDEKGRAVSDVEVIRCMLDNFMPDDTDL